MHVSELCLFRRSVLLPSRSLTIDPAALFHEVCRVHSRFCCIRVPSDPLASAPSVLVHGTRPRRPTRTERKGCPVPADPWDGMTPGHAERPRALSWVFPRLCVRHFVGVLGLPTRTSFVTFALAYLPIGAASLPAHASSFTGANSRLRPRKRCRRRSTLAEPAAVAAASYQGGPARCLWAAWRPQSMRQPCDSTLSRCSIWSTSMQSLLSDHRSWQATCQPAACVVMRYVTLYISHCAVWPSGGCGGHAGP